MRTIHRDIVSAMLFSKDGKLLRALQPPHGVGPYPGCWAIIGGGIDVGEDQRAALNREFVEETGIDIPNYTAEPVDVAEDEAEKSLRDTGERVLAKMKFYTYRIIMHDKNADEILVTLSDEHIEYRWTLMTELKNMKLTPPSAVLFKKLGYL